MNAEEARPLPRPSVGAQLGYLRHLFAQPHQVLEEVRGHHGPVVGLGAGPLRLAIVGDPVAIADLFAEPTESYRWNHRFNMLARFVGKESIIVSDGTDYHRRRGAIQAGFSRRRLNGWIPMIVDTTDAAIDRLVASHEEPGQVIDMSPVGRSLVLHIVVRALCGPRLVRRAQEIGDLLERTQDYLEAPALRQIPHPFPFGQRHRARQDRRAFDAIIDDEIARLRATPDGDELNVLETIVTTGELTDSEIRDQIVTVLGAGFDTTSATLSWLLLRAAEAPGLWDRLADEADAAFSKTGDEREPDHTTLASLDLANRTVREALRLHPPGAFGLRQTLTDVTAGGYLFPRRTLIAWSPHLAGRDPHSWADPLRFDPDRHLDLTPEQAAHAKTAWVPFGGGARNCIGFALAQIELTLMLARLAQRLHLAPARTAEPARAERRQDVQERDDPHLPSRRSHPQGGARLHVTPR